MKPKYRIVVSEPFDFVSSDGTNMIKGEIIKKYSDKLVLFKSDHQIIYDKIKGNLLLLSPRYSSQKFYSDDFSDITIGGALLLIDDYDDKDTSYLEKNSKYILIGSLEKI